MQQTANLTAGARTRVDVAGRHFLVLSTGAATSIELWIYRDNDELEYIRTAMRGFKARIPDGFTRIEVRSTVDAVCEFVLSNGVVDFDFITGQAVTIGGPLPVPVSNDRGSPGNLLHVVGVTVADAPAVAASSNVAVACSAVAAVIAAADANRRALRICNLGPDPVSIGPAGLTWARRVVVLLAGDVWVEDRGANLAWSGITDAALNASVTWQGVTA